MPNHIFMGELFVLNNTFMDEFSIAFGAFQGAIKVITKSYFAFQVEIYEKITKENMQSKKKRSVAESYLTTKVQCLLPGGESIYSTKNQGY